MNEIYRDRSEGTAARRQDLLQKRRDELVTMPHAVRRVVVARRARIAGSFAVIAVGVPLAAAILKPALAALIARALPGGAPAPLSTLLFAGWLAGVAGYLAARARAEHRFAVAMSRMVLPGRDVDHDVERLSHERPDEAARAMAHRLEVASVALPVLAAGLLVPATAMFAARAIALRTWPSISDFEADLAGHATVVGTAAVAGIVGAIAMTRRALRLSAIAPIAGVATTIFAGLALAEHSWWLVTPTAIAAAIAAVTWRLHRERGLIEAEDPAAGSELFTVRGLIRSVRTQLARARAALSRVSLRRSRWQIAGTAAVLTGIGAYLMTAHDAKGPTTHTEIFPSVHAPAVAPAAQDVVRSVGGGALSVEVALRSDNSPVEVDNLAVLPRGWHAEVKIRMIDDVRHGDFRVTAFPQDPGAEVRVIHTTDYEQILTIDNCLSDGSLGLRVEPLYRVAPGEHVSFTVEPMLTLANCKG